MTAALSALLLTLACAAPAARHEVAYVRLPRQVTEGVPFQVTVRYAVPGDAEIALRCELKDRTHVVLTGAGTRVRGRGEATLELTAPVGAARELFLATWMGDDWQASPCGILDSPTFPVVTQQEAAAMEAARREAAAQAAELRRQAGPRGLAGVFGWRGGQPPELPEALAARLRAAGIGAVVLSEAQIADPYLVTPELFDLVVLCDSRVMPGPAAQTIGEYAGRGGALMVLGGPAFGTLLWPHQGRWIPREELLDALIEELEPTVHRDFARDLGGEWERGTNDAAAAAGVRWEDGAARIDIANLTGWETFGAPAGPPIFAPGHTWLTLRARGSAATRQLSIELRERDGSRWIAVVTLTEPWRRIAVPPESFAYWHDSASRGRGGPGDRVNPANVEQVVVGLAFTHTTSVGAGRHTIWIDDLGSAPAPANARRIEEMSRGLGGAPRIETVSPSYKLYPVTNLARLRTHPVQALVPALEAPRPAALSAPHRRPNGTGLDKQRRWRMQPLLECLDADGKVCGSAASLTIAGTDPATGGLTLSMPINDAAFWRRPAVQAWLVAAAARLLDGLFLYEGGAAYYASFGGETMPLGALVSNRGKQPATATVEAEVSAGGQWRWGSHWTVTVPPGGATRVAGGWAVPAGGGPYQVTVTLRREGRVIDRLRHELNVWQPTPEPEWVTIRDGDFHLGGRPWYPHGVNYMPSTGIGIDDGAYFEFWLDPQPYDPEYVERDLEDCAAIGFNMLSVFQYHRSMASRNLLDLLLRCRRHGLKVNLSLRPGTPLEFPWELVREMITAGRLAENDTIFAYDLAWEPQWGNHAMRRPHDAAWAAWVDQEYGNLAAAEAVWGVAAPRQEGRLTNPTDDLAGSTAHAKLLLDYRRFLNALLHEKYGRARELVRSIDPRHAVSFRMSEAGNPTVPPSWIAYDFAGLKDAVDLFCPEGYGRIGDWERVKPGWFTTAYARAVNPSLPVMWAEFGNTSWDMTTMTQDPARLAFIAKFYDDYYQMAYRSGANGTVCWWFPGGFRVGENSDYGILNPDRSWREVTEVIHRWAPRMTAPRPIPRPEVWLEFDPDNQPQGLWGIYAAHQEAFWRAIEQGRTPGLRAVRGEGR